MKSEKNRLLRFSFVFASILLLVLQLDPARLIDDDQHEEGGLWQPTTMHPVSEGKPLDATESRSFTSGGASDHVDSSNDLELSWRTTLETKKRQKGIRPVETINTTYKSTVASTSRISTSTHPTTNSFRKTPTQLQEQEILPSIVVQLQGQLGNNLCRIAHGRGIQLQLQRDYGIKTQLVLQPPLQDGKRNRQWRFTRIELEQCFPHVSSSAPFLESHTSNSQDVIKQLQREQMRWLSSIQDRVAVGNTTTNVKSGKKKPNKGDTLQSIFSNGINGKLLHNYKVELESERLEEALRLFRDVLLVRGATNATALRSAGVSSSSVGAGPASSHNIAIPFLVANILASDYMVDHFDQDLRQYFEFGKSCCKEIPAPDETVLHFRNFATNVGSRPDSSSIFVELSANKTATELLGHLKPGNKVAITSRYHNEETKLYVQALEARGLQVRVVTGQSGMQDFCFLVKTQKELVGNAISTYCKWAALLGNATIARLYITDRPYFRHLSKGYDLVSFFGYNWTNPALQRRIKFEVYKTEETVDYWTDAS